MCHHSHSLRSDFPAGTTDVEGYHPRGARVPNGAQIGLALGSQELVLLDSNGNVGARFPYPTLTVQLDEVGARISGPGDTLYLIVDPASWVSGEALVGAITARA